MSTYTLHCPPLDGCGPCGTLPMGFVRLRYFFGKRMGVADFVDEQRYHAGKMQFHNQRLHGAGLLCGLGVSRHSATEVILRVGKGAAIDACGREILVGYDQCIDLDAWYRRELAERRETDATWPEAALDASGNLPLVVAIRFRDRATTPEPAPRDPCSCDAAGCDFGRVREEFELDLFPATGTTFAPTPLVPARDALGRVLASSVSGSALAHGLAVAATAGCPEPSPDEWLPLATVTVELGALDGAPRAMVADIEVIEPRPTLLAETALLQELLARELSAQLEAAALVDGPEIVTLALVRDGTTDVYWLDLELSQPVIAQTVPTGAFTLSVLATTGTPGWTDVPVTTQYVAPTATTRARLRVRVDNATGVLAGDRLYRLALDPAEVLPATPIVDDRMRTLRPLRPSYHFSLRQDTTALVLAPAPYAS